MLKLDNVSEKAKIGQILILIAIILKVLSVGGIFFMAGTIGTMIPFVSILPFGMSALLLFLGLIALVGIFVGFMGLKSASEGDFHRAGIMGIIASFLPPLDVVMLAGGILCIISEEAD